MQKWPEQLAERLRAGESAVLVTILQTEGSTPRGIGTVMAVLQDGATLGTVGGGNVEYEAQQRALELLQSGCNEDRWYGILQSGNAPAGRVRLHFHHLAGAETAGMLERLAQLCRGSGGAWLVRRLSGAEVVSMEAVTRSEADEQLLQSRSSWTDGVLSVMVERPGRLYLLGAGHVAQCLAAAVAPLGFRTVVFDDRPEFAAAERFPAAEEVLYGDFADLSRQIHVTPEDYVVVMSRVHETDFEALRQVLRSGARYIGCIGSRRKLAACREKLLAAGFTDEEFSTVHAPIGLAIGAETPEEIAVSIAAELIAVRAGIDSVASLSAKRRNT